MPLSAAEHRTIDPDLQRQHAAGRTAWQRHWHEYRQLRKRVATLELEQRALQADLLLSSAARENAVYMVECLREKIGDLTTALQGQRERTHRLLNEQEEDFAATLTYHGTGAGPSRN